MKFGNWENEEAFKIIDNLFDEIVSIYTLLDIYHLEPGKVTTESGNYVQIQNKNQLKSLFKNQLITIIEFKDGSDWNLKENIIKKSLKSSIPRRARIFELQKSMIRLYKDPYDKYILPEIKDRFSYEEYRYPQSEDLGTCQICFDSLKSDNRSDVSVIKECGHMFHTDCVKDHIHSKRSCPICRTKTNKIIKVAPQYIPRVSNFGKAKKITLKQINELIKKIK